MDGMVNRTFVWTQRTSHTFIPMKHFHHIHSKCVLFSEGIGSWRNHQCFKSLDLTDWSRGSINKVHIYKDFITFIYFLYSINRKNRTKLQIGSFFGVCLDSVHL